MKVAFRWKVLVLVADTASGKSAFAESLFRNPYIITVEDADHLDLRGFDYETHDGLILDNVNCWALLRKWRAVLQARNLPGYRRGFLVFRARCCVGKTRKPSRRNKKNKSITR